MLFDQNETGPLETSRILASDADLAARLIAVANTVRRGAGIAATSLEGATVRLGAARTRAWALTCEIADLLASVSGETIPFHRFWRCSLWRGCLAQALAMNVDPRITAEAFLVGALQDVGVPLLAAENPSASRRIFAICETSPQRQAMLEWQAFDANHLHLGRGMLQGWNLPPSVSVAVDRHHSRPPMASIPNRAGRLWQIAYLVAGVPTVSGPTKPDPVWGRIMSAAFAIEGPSLTAWLRQSAEEYRDAYPLFAPITDDAPVDALVDSAAAFLDVPSPTADGQWPDQLSPPVERRGVHTARERMTAPTPDVAPAETLRAS
jgi:hypothetical protein